MNIRIRKLSPLAIFPSYATAGSAAMDLYALEPSTIWPGFPGIISTGIAIEIPPGFEGQIRPRSGLALRHGVTVLNAPGTIDSDFRGEVKVLLVNHGPNTARFDPGDRIAQLVIAPVIRVTLVESGELSETARGAGGFGHTGVK